MGLTAATNFAVYEAVRTRCGEQSLWGVGCGAFVSGVFSSLVSSPISLIKVQQQVVSTLGMFATARDLYRRYSIYVFYRGYYATFLNETIGRTIYFIVYEQLKIYFANLFDSTIQYQKYEKHPLSSSLSVRMTSAAIAGIISWLSIYPIDVIKSKLQIDVDGHKYNNSMIKCFQVTYKEGGIKALTRGLGFTLIRAAPVAGTVLPIYEFSKDALNKHL